MTEFEALVSKLQNAPRGNFVLSAAQRKILLDGIKALRTEQEQRQ